MELRRRKDAWGTSFEFIVNGIPIFAKGANWVPTDMFPGRIARERYRQEHDLQPNSGALADHQKDRGGNEKIRKALLRDYPPPSDLHSLIYLSQLAEVVKTTAEHLRQNMPRPMGSLYWQLNDCWPAISWSSIDYFGRWKALQYYARRFYQDLLISPVERNGSVEVYVVSDRRWPTEAVLETTLMDLVDGRSLLKSRRRIHIPGLQSQRLVQIPIGALLEGRNPRRVLLYFDLRVENRSASTNSFFFESCRNLSLPRAKIQLAVLPTANGFRVRLKSDRYSRTVALSLKNGQGHFSDNYFGLLPQGRTKSI